MARKSTPEKPPTKQEASVAGKALRTGKATPAQIRSMAGRIELRARVAQTQAEVTGGAIWSYFISTSANAKSRPRPRFIA